jgi:hypothetical protein
MKPSAKHPPKPNREETERLKNFIWLEEPQFDALFRAKCIELSSIPVKWKVSLRNHVATKAQVYGLRAVRVHDRQSCIVNFFIRYQRRLYQAYSMNEACNLVDLLKKEATFENYEKNVKAGKFNEKDN